MSEEEQEQFKDYLELEYFLDIVNKGQHEKRVHALAAEQVDLYRIALQLRLLTPDAIHPRPEFVSRLQQQLLVEEEQLRERREIEALPAVPAPDSELASSLSPTPLPTPFMQGIQATPLPAPHPVIPLAPRRGGRRLPRRLLLFSGIAAASTFVVGSAVGGRIEQSHTQAELAAAQKEKDEEQESKTMPLISANMPKRWLQVTTLSDLGRDAVRFSSEAIVGYVLHETDNITDSGNIIALSAACTHMGCLLNWQADRSFLCPCHEGYFMANGAPDVKRSAIEYLTPLPRLRTKVENGNVYVEVPAPGASG
jgi:Rieske Fe-S protein